MRFFLHKLQVENTTKNFIYYNKKKNEFYVYIMIIQLKIFVCQMPEKIMRVSLWTHVSEFCYSEA